VNVHTAIVETKLLCGKSYVCGNKAMIQKQNFLCASSMSISGVIDMGVNSNELFSRRHKLKESLTG